MVSYVLWIKSGFWFLCLSSLREDEIKLWLTNQSLVIVCTQVMFFMRKKKTLANWRTVFYPDTTATPGYKWRISDDYAM